MKNRRLLGPVDTRTKAVPSSTGPKKDGSNKLAGKRVFLDITDARRARTVELKLRKLKAVIETFLTKGVNYVVTSSKSQSKSKTQAPRSVSPAFSNTPSPFHFTPSAASATPSPTYRNAEGKLVPLSRGQAMAQMARARNRSPSPSGAVATASKLGIRIIYIEDAEKWLDKELKKRGLTITEETSPQQEAQESRRGTLSKTRQLLDPFLKVEPCSQEYRPQHKELTTWPHINVATPSGTCPFDGVGVSVAQRSKAVSKEPAASAGPAVSPGTQSNTQRRSLEGEDLVGVPILTAGDLRRQQEKQKQEQRRRGYCECCHARYDDIDKHLKEPGHAEFARDKNNYEILDDLISQLPSPSQFLHNTLLRHCSKHQGEKPAASTSGTQAAEETSTDQVLTVSYSTPTKPSSPPAERVHAAPEMGMEVTGFQTPTHSPQYPPTAQAAAGREQRMSQAEVSLSHESDADGGAKDQSKPLSAVVIRRPGARSAYGSPRDKWSHSRSPYGRESPRTPKKVQERSMVFGNTSIGSLQSVPEDPSLMSGLVENSDRPGRRQGGDTDAGGSGDRHKGPVFSKQREQSPQPSTSGTAHHQLKSLSSLSHGSSPAEESVEEGRSGKSLPKVSSLKRKRISSVSQDTEVAAEIKTPTAHSKQLSQQGRGTGAGDQKNSDSDQENESNKKKKSLRKKPPASKRLLSSGRTQHQKETLESKNTESEKESGETENIESGKETKDSSTTESGVIQISEKDVHSKDTESETAYSLPAQAAQTVTSSTTHELDKVKSEGGVQEQPDMNLHGPVPEQAQSPPKGEPQTPQKAVYHVMEEDQVGSSPVYSINLTTSTPSIVPVRKLRSQRSGLLSFSDEEGSPAAKKIRRRLLRIDDQPGPSGTSSAQTADIEPSISTGTEKSSGKKQNMASRNTEQSAFESRDSSLRSEESSSGEKETTVSRKTRSEERSLQRSKKPRLLRSEGRSGSRSEGRSGSRSEGRSGPKSEESSVLASGEESAESSQKSDSRSRESSTSRSKGSSLSRSRERRERSGRGESSASGGGHNQPASQVSPETEEKGTKRRSSRLKKATPQNSTAETTRGEGVLDSFRKSSDSCITEDGGSGHSAQASRSSHSGQSVDIAKIDGAPSLCIKLVRCPQPQPVQTSTKKVKLSRSWQLLSDNSMSRLLKSETEGSSFEGFQGDEALPSDLTYVSASEVEVTDDEEREWVFDNEALSDPPEEEQESESLREFIPTFSSPGKSNSSWDDACDLYVSQSVEQQLKSKQIRRSPRKTSAVQGKKRKCSKNTAGSEAKKRKTKKKEENERNLQHCGMHTPSKRERKNGVLCDSDTLMNLDKEVLLNCTSPRKHPLSVPLSPLKVWNGEVREPLLQSPKQSHSISLPAQLPPPFKI